MRFFFLRWEKEKILPYGMHLVQKYTRIQRHKKCQVSKSSRKKPNKPTKLNKRKQTKESLQITTSKTTSKNKKNRTFI